MDKQTLIEKLNEDLAHEYQAVLTPFGRDTALRYALVASPESETLHARMEGGRITVRVPVELAQAWTQTDRVSLEAQQTVDGARTLHLLVEKDVGCRHRSPGGEADMFEHLRQEPAVRR